MPILEFNKKIFDSEQMDSDLTSETLDISEIKSVGLHFLWENGSSPVGTLFIQVSNDGNNFVNLNAGNSISGNSGSSIENNSIVPFAYMRIFYDRTSGDAELTVYASAKNL